MVTVAWGLRRLAIPELLPAMLDQANSILNGFRSGKLDENMPHQAQAAQLFMAFGQMNYRPANEVMREYVPKNFSLGDESRPAAVWALGLIYRGEAPQDLTTQFVRRLQDVVSPERPETDYVRRMSAVSLARMESTDALPAIREFASPYGGNVGLACMWAVEQMTGEKPPVIVPGVLSYHDWFLGPLRGDRDEASAGDGTPAGDGASADEGADPESSRSERD